MSFKVITPPRLDRPTTDTHSTTRDVKTPKPSKNLSRRDALTIFGGVAFLESLFLPVFLDALLISLVMRGQKIRHVLGAGFVGSVLGTLVWYAAGLWMGQDTLTFATDMFASDSAILARAQDLWATNWWAAVFIAGVTPIPDPLLASLAGMSGKPFGWTLLAIVSSHAVRFLLMGLLVTLATRFAKTRSPKTQTRIATLSMLVVGLSLLGGIFFVASKLW